MKSTKHFHVLLTCVGGYYIYDMIRALREAGDFEVTVTGVDTDPQARWKDEVDHFCVVPPAEEKEGEYLNAILGLAREKGISAVIPLSEGESRVLARHGDLLRQHGILTPLSPSQTVEMMTDKFLLMRFLESRGFDPGPFYCVDDLQEAHRALKGLGYPAVPVVLKKRKSAGARDVLIVDQHARELETLSDRGAVRGDFDSILMYVLNRKLSWKGHLAMPFYGFHIYDVDCLAVEGKAVNVVPRLRQWENPLSAFSQGCRIAMEKDVIACAEKMCEAFHIHGSCDFDVVRTPDGALRVLDASCRMSGSVGAAVAAGVNIPAQLVRIMFGLPLAEQRPPDGMELRPVAMRFVAMKKI